MIVSVASSLNCITILSVSYTDNYEYLSAVGNAVCSSLMDKYAKLQNVTLNIQQVAVLCYFLFHKPY